MGRGLFEKNYEEGCGLAAGAAEGMPGDSCPGGAIGSSVTRSSAEAHEPRWGARSAKTVPRRRPARGWRW
jgi:hypothetical protein